MDHFWKLLDEEFKPKANKILSVVTELWTRYKQNSLSLNEWITKVYNLVEICQCGDTGG